VFYFVSSRKTSEETPAPTSASTESAPPASNLDWTGLSPNEAVAERAALNAALTLEEQNAKQRIADPQAAAPVRPPAAHSRAVAASTATSPPAPSRPATTQIRLDPKHPLKVGEEYYPDASKRAGEQGRCVVQLTVAADGSVNHETIQQSTGFPRLDAACLNAVHGQRLIPATQNGQPIEQTVSLPIEWTLSN
jgi:protein TonB